MAIHDFPSLTISLQQNSHYQPGDRVKGTVSISSSDNTTTTQLDKLQLAWRGTIKSTIGSENEQCIDLFHETRQIDLNVVHRNPAAPAFVLATAQSPPPPPLIVEEQSDLLFDLYLVKGMPSSLEVSEPQAKVQISYSIEVTGYYNEQRLHHQLYVPVVAAMGQHQIDEQETDQQQTDEVAYLVESSSNLHDPCRSAARITVPCKVIPQGMILPVVGHIWHDHSRSREKAISLALIRYTTITCHDREETLVHEMDTAQFDLELVEHQDYAVQTLSQTLWIPPACIPSMDISAGRLVNVRYQVRFKVDIEPDAVYRHADNQHTTNTMAVDVPLIIYAKGNNIAAAPSPSASTDTQLSQPTSSSGRQRNSVNLGNNGKMRERFKSMFKKRDSVRLKASTTTDTSSNTSKLSSTTSLRGAFGSLKIKSSNNVNNDNRASSINTITPSSSRNSSVTGSLSPPHSSSLPPKAFSSLPLSSPSPPPPPQLSFSTPEAISQDDTTPPMPPPPQLSFAPPEAISQDDTTPPMPPSLPILRSLSIKHPSSAEQSALQMMTSTTATTEPVPPIPLVEGGGVYTFHIFADSSDEEDNVGEESKIQGTQASSLSRSGSFLSSVGKQGSLDTASYNQYNNEENDKRDIDGSDTEDTQIYTVSSSGIGKLDQVSDSSDDDEDPGESSSEEEDGNDLLSLLAKRERRIERKKERGSSSSRQRR